MSFKKIRQLLLVITSLSLVACSSTTTLAPMTDTELQRGFEKRYRLSDDYADHRAQQRVFESTGGNIAYLDYGQGPTIVLLHGVPSSSWLYRKMLVELQDDYRVIAIDLLGFGSSDKPHSSAANYDPKAQALYVEQVLDHLGISAYSLLFHDMGGLVAWEMVDKDLEGDALIENLIVLNTIISKEGFNHPHLEKGIAARIMSQSFSNSISSATALSMTFDNMGLSSNASLSEQECNGYVVPMKEGNGDVLYDFYTGFDDVRFTRLNRQVNGLSRFNGKVLVLWGEQDTVLTTGQIPVLQKAAQVDPSNIHIFSNNAHFLPEEIPQILNQHVREFLSTQ